ncbi:MAG: LysR family transcriptional regulator [Streptosporangiaceae bacterium]
MALASSTLPQPALSKQIRMLERQLGAALFERDRQCWPPGSGMRDRAASLFVRTG